MAAIDPTIFFVLVPCAIVLAILQMKWRSNRAVGVIHQWAETHGFRLISCEKTISIGTPFFFRKTKGQVVYYVTVQNPEGEISKAWIRCGNMVIGLLSDEIAVRWDAPKPGPAGFPVILKSDDEPGDRQ